MPAEVLHYLNCRPGKVYVDCTLGGAGHARLILEKIFPDGFLIGIDQDIDAIRNARRILQPFAPHFEIFHRNFSELPQILSSLDIQGVDGIVLDLGLSLHQLEAGGRGFSFKKEEPLDMRMDIETHQTAEYLVNDLAFKDLCRIFREYGEERLAGPITRKIVQVRRTKRIQTSRELAQIVTDAVPRKVAARQKIHPATRVFMALRIAVNQELERLRCFMGYAADLLNPGGRLCVISFHSLEDRIVKQRIRELEKDCTCPPDFPICVCHTIRKLQSLTRKAIKPAAEEIAVNPMARSARLRAAEKV
jgi:16S rRNA (cytosine1402-N4)-methyltransferase